MRSSKTNERTTELISKKDKAPPIGGPGSSLPFAVESFLSWTLAISCLSVSGYHYLVATFVSPTFTWFRQFFGSDGKHQNGLPCWLPLTTASRDELDRHTPAERLDQLSSLLKVIAKTNTSSWSDEQLVENIRSNEICRRLASLATRPTTSENALVSKESPCNDLKERLVRVWPALLMLPPVGKGNEYEISMIIPAYRERGSDVLSKLNRALDACRHPNRVQVIVVDAGSCEDLQESVESLMNSWGELLVVAFASGGGRGPCLNYGAIFASGRFYSFCHSDTTLPRDWDVKVIKALSETRSIGGNEVRANSCAFSFGVDTSEAGLNGEPYPPGIKAVETTANLRTHIYSLPYGDQVLSVPATVFNYIGGFPDQCLMEDYELISLLRRRSALIRKFGITDRERLAIIKQPAALCSPRRWQKFGVLYVTSMNSKFVNLYAGGMTPDDLFAVYYGRPPPSRASSMSPWEKRLFEVISKK